MKKILTLTLCLALLLGLFSGCGGKRYDPLAGVETTAVSYTHLTLPTISRV